MSDNETFITIVRAVLENNRINNAEWKDWENVNYLQAVYGRLNAEYRDVAEAFLSALIRDNGEGLQYYKDAYQQLVCGQVLHPN